MEEYGKARRALYDSVVRHMRFFNVLLTVHLSIFILVINQLDAQNLSRPVHRLRADSQPVHGTATYRRDDTRCCIIQF